jgi:hypothetical protein
MTLSPTEHFAEGDRPTTKRDALAASSKHGSRRLDHRIGLIVS